VRYGRVVDPPGRTHLSVVAECATHVAAAGEPNPIAKKNIGSLARRWTNTDKNACGNARTKAVTTHDLQMQ
jgi:hypothetical protein